MASRGPECGHSACSQHYIDTGNAECVVAVSLLDHESGGVSKPAAALLAAAREVTTQFCDFEAMTDEAAAAMRALRAEILGAEKGRTIKPHDFVTPKYICAECSESMFHSNHYTGPFPREPPQLGMW